MIALGFVNIVFASHLSYIVLERKERCYKERNFWWLLLGLLASIYITIVAFQLI